MTVELVIPVLNEQARLAESVPQLCRFLGEHCPWYGELVIADNGSTDRTWELSRGLERQYPSVRAIHLDLKGRGRALKQVWLESQADVLSYMDVDLSADLAAFPEMIDGLVSGGYDVATGSRLLPASQTTRCWKRECISRCYNWLVRAAFQTHFSDAQCGFKAITRRAAQELLPLVEDNGWFFDTELLVLAEKLGYRILNLPVRWVENRDSRVNICRTALEDIKGMLRLRRRLREGGLRTGGNERPEARKEMAERRRAER